jgi:tRNA nucleotidyltransferase/poly(A) polymerase
MSRKHPTKIRDKFILRGGAMCDEHGEDILLSGWAKDAYNRDLTINTLFLGRT